MFDHRITTKTHTREPCISNRAGEQGGCYLSEACGFVVCNGRKKYLNFVTYGNKDVILQRYILSWSVSEGFIQCQKRLSY